MCILFICTVWNISTFGVFSGLYFLVSEIQSKCRKIQTWKTPNSDTLECFNYGWMKWNCVKVVCNCEISKQQNNMMDAGGVLIKTNSYIKTRLDLFFITLNINTNCKNLILAYIKHEKKQSRGSSQVYHWHSRIFKKLLCEMLAKENMGSNTSWKLARLLIQRYQSEIFYL